MKTIQLLQNGFYYFIISEIEFEIFEILNLYIFSQMITI